MVAPMTSALGEVATLSPVPSDLPPASIGGLDEWGLCEGHKC
jgi:hypothetical protein